MDINKLIALEKALNTHYVGAKINSHICIFKEPIVDKKGNRIKNIARNNATKAINVFIKFKHVRAYENFPFVHLDEETKEFIYNALVKQ